MNTFMKNLLILIFTILLLGSCSSYSSFNQTKSINNKKATDKTVVSKDSSEYELVILDPGFESWFITHNLLASAHSNQYYKNWNHRYVLEWNRLHLQGHPYFENLIDFSPMEDYGFDVNYKLYYYFLFVEDKIGITLVQRGK